MPLNRRHFILSSAAAGAAGATGSLAAGPALAQESALPAYAAFKDAADVIVHTERTIETKREAQGGSLTPTEDLYVRNNLPAPDASIVADRDAWDVAFEGVANPGTMTLGELKTFGIETVAAVLQCSGNGRAFFDHEASGTQWATGAAGNVLWTGVPLKTVVDALGGPADGATYLTGTGGETIPEGLDPLTIQVERSVPVKALDNALLAYALNGQPLSVAHGGPLRLVVPGYYGVNNVKYVKRVALTAEQSGAKIQQSGYRVRPVGESGGPDQPSMWEMTVKSWVTRPLMDGSGRVIIEGVAMGGTHALDTVDVSVDGGASWQPASFTGPDMGRFAWRPFALVTTLEPGTHTVASRATDSEGSSQPEDVEPNHRAYGHNGWRDHAIDITVS